MDPQEGGICRELGPGPTLLMMSLWVRRRLRQSQHRPWGKEQRPICEGTLTESHSQRGPLSYNLTGRQLGSACLSVNPLIDKEAQIGEKACPVCERNSRERKKIPVSRYLHPSLRATGDSVTKGEDDTLWPPQRGCFLLLFL